MVKENTMNTKYEITDIAHEKYPFLHRIRALRDIGSEVKTGDLGGFVEFESNLSFEPGDDAWMPVSTAENGDDRPGRFLAVAAIERVHSRAAL